MAREAGAEGDDIMFTSNNTTFEEFSTALDSPESIINFDDISFLDKPYWGSDIDFPETVSFRINPGKAHQGGDFIGKPEESKYGIMINQINEAYTEAKKMGAKKFGMHTMLCSNDLNFHNVADTIRMLIKFAINLNGQTGIKLSFINIGGGMGIPYKSGDDSFKMDHLLETISSLQKSLPFHMDFYMESGRYVAGPHGVLVNRAINRKDTYQTHVGVETAMPGLMRPAMYGAYHEISVVDSKSGKDKAEVLDIPKEMWNKVNVVGGICENCDRLATDRSLPPIRVGEIDGDFIVTADCGAYAAAMGFNYNGRTRPKGLLLREDGKVVLVVREEIVSDLLSRTEGL